MQSFNSTERDAVYRVMKARRDIRRFQSKPVPPDALSRILEAAHHAPSVGFKQPWNFILIDSTEVRQRIKETFEKTNEKEWKRLTDTERSRLYSRLKLEGIMEAPLNIAVTCDRSRDAPFVLGQGPMPETDLYSTCLAIQNMWLAARAEEIGVGWVSILDRKETERILHLPDQVQLVAYLCVGYPVEFREKPMLESVGWKSRLDWNSLVYENRWGRPCRFF
ncbi:5,6-dimethylbenzimidazole synthase [Paludifilum halophilum]|uniref:5,6-dimethylbenzimidazole synthase n=1 Tax=Paludifilum halophilum TaxID=1642702 RepID=A0A235BBY2_9BACL|nr:5,6-dimethylbenzimidazole synthase [Paludifilum halophilum]OYD09794.1 5,6-dimethylbenzimidazole synthase [Paludifilum halophilum]